MLSFARGLLKKEQTNPFQGLSAVSPRNNTLVFAHNPTIIIYTSRSCCHHETLLWVLNYWVFHNSNAQYKGKCLYSLPFLPVPFSSGFFKMFFFYFSWPSSSLFVLRIEWLSHLMIYSHSRLLRNIFVRKSIIPGKTLPFKYSFKIIPKQAVLRFP